MDPACFTTYGRNCKEPEPLPDCPMVEIKQGKLIGKTCLDQNKKLFYSYMSIPFAKPPLKKLRFMAPKRAGSWKGVLDASKDMPKCIQQIGITKKMQGQEDCLYLNVHTNMLPTENEPLRPVMFYIHGGAFIQGSGNTEYCGAEFIMPYDIVLVTANYRLGVLGFVSSTENILDVFGNMGLKDQTMALEWTRDNISKFGGNPDNVTIFGQSAGAACVNFHILSPMSKGLFHKALSLSGSALCPWCTGRKGTFETLGNKFKLPKCNNLLKMLRKLQAMPVEAIVSTTFRDTILVPVIECHDFAPIVEDQTTGVAFLPASPMDIYKSGEYNHVPYIIGYTNLDGLFIEVVSRLNTGKPFILEDMSYAIPTDLPLDSKDVNTVQDQIKKFYFKEEEPAEDNLRQFCDLATDVWITNGIAKTIRAQLDNGDRVYFYRFGIDTNLNFYKGLTPETKTYTGACHVDDLGYIFKTKYTRKVCPGTIEESSIDSILKMWTNFARYGKPSSKKDSFKWLPVSKTKRNYLEIGLMLIPGLDPDQKRFDFWENIYSKYYKEPPPMKKKTNIIEEVEEELDSNCVVVGIEELRQRSRQLQGA